MSTLRTFNLQHPESSNNNIQLAEGGGVSVTAGILTATNVSSTNVTTTEVTATNGTFSGNLSVGGVLSYEDVTNVDSTGIGTFRNGIHVTGGLVGIGTDNPTNAYGIDKSLHVHSSLSSGTRGSGVHLTTNASGNTANDGVSMRLVDTDLSIDNRESGLINFLTAGTERLRITSAGALNIGKGDESGAVENLVELYVGANDGSHATIRGKYNRTNEYNRSEIRFGVEQNASGLGFLAFATGNNSASERLRITSAGDLALGDSAITGYEKFYCKGSHSGTSGIYIHNANGATNSSADLWFGNWTTAATNANYSARISAINKNVNTGVTDLIFHIYDGNNVQERLRITSDGKMGLGTQTPGQTLSISGSSAGLGIYNTGNNHGNVYFFKDGTPKGWLKYRGNDDKLVIGNVTDAIYVKTDGNVGVGNADPTQARLVAQTASGMSIAAIKENTGASISLGGITQPRILMEAGATASQFKLYTASGSSYSSAGWRQRLHITDTSASVASTGSGANGIGCFGIADNSPDSRALALSIGGGNGLYGIEDSRPMVYLQRSYGIGGGSSTDETTLEVNAPGSYNSAGIIYGIKSRAQHNLNGSHYAGHFEAHGSQYSANGTSALYAKTTKLDTNGSGDVIAFRADASITQGIANNGAAIAGYFSSGNNINGKPIVCLNGLTSNNWANQIIFRKHNGSGIVDVGSIKSSNTATQYNTNSDYRLKENVISLTGAIDRLKQLQPKRFNFIGVDETIDGFIAHEVTSVAPYAVSGEKDAVKKELVMGEDGKEQFDENGEIIIEEVIDPQSVDYSKLTTLTIAALQEALAKIETLEAKVAVLEG